VYLDTTTSILKRLRYSRGIGQVQVRYFRVQDVSEKIIEVGMAALIYTPRPGCFHFVLECSASFWQIESSTTPILARFQLMRHAVVN